jgi:hypothetical protein
MSSILKSALLGAALAVGGVAAAQAQYVATLPPDNSPQTAVTEPYGSTQSFFPKPGGSVIIHEHSSQPAGYAAGPAPVAQPDANPYSHPYTSHVGPKTE